MWRTVLAVPVRRLSRFGGVYALYLSIVWLFDYVYFPWLTIKFHALVFLPLYVSIFLVSWGGFYLYQYFQEDVFFAERVNQWLERPATGKVSRWVRDVISKNPRCAFAAISTWWSPLHAYVFFRRDKSFEFLPFIQAMAEGSLFCTFFWGLVGESFVFSWHLFRVFIR
jgi:hypothetical protein